VFVIRERLYAHPVDRTQLDTPGRTPLEEWSARRRKGPLPTQHTKTRLEHPCTQRDSKSTCPHIRRLQNYTLDRTATGVGPKFYNSSKFYFLNFSVMPIPVAVRSEALVCGILLPGIAGSNPKGAWMSVYCECCVLQVQWVGTRDQNKNEINTCSVITLSEFWLSRTLILKENRPFSDKELLLAIEDWL